MTLAGVWGAGAEGRSAARDLLDQGYKVVVSQEAPSSRPEGLDARARFVSGAGALAHLLGCTIVVCSPGIPRVHPFRAELTAAGVPTTTVTAQWMQRAGTTTIGVTGTKGKSTTATLIGLLLEGAGADTQVGGNIGVPLADMRGDVAVTVAELSSYQCASLTRAPRLAVLTSLYEDHLTWHGSKDAYWEDKARIFGEGCEVLVCDDATLDTVREAGFTTPSQVLVPDEALSARLAALSFAGPLGLGQNLANFALAVLAVQWWLARPLTDEELRVASDRFSPLPHRLEPVSQHGGILWIDDTLATVPEAVIAALEAFAGEVVLMVGGEERGVDYRGLNTYLLGREPRPFILAIPGNGARIVADYRRAHPLLVEDADSLDAAVSRAAEVASAGSTVLLSPGAPSYDQYRNYEHKSAAYVAAIKVLGQ